MGALRQIANRFWGIRQSYADARIREERAARNNRYRQQAEARSHEEALVKKIEESSPAEALMAAQNILQSRHDSEMVDEKMNLSWPEFYAALDKAGKNRRDGEENGQRG